MFVSSQIQGSEASQTYWDTVSLSILLGDFPLPTGGRGLGAGNSAMTMSLRSLHFTFPSLCSTDGQAQQHANALFFSLQMHVRALKFAGSKAFQACHKAWP